MDGHETESRAAGGRDQRPVAGVLALQGSFPLHVRALEHSGVAAREVRRVEDLEGISGLILPGGESTVLSLLSRQYGLFDALRELGRAGLPMFGTCAGAILLGQGDERPPRLGLVDIDVERNAYGRQLESFTADVRLENSEAPFHGVFIRAPRFRLRPGSDIEVIGRHGDEPVLVRSGHFLLSTFHPELTDDLRLHRLFLESALTRNPHGR